MHTTIPKHIMLIQIIVPFLTVSFLFTIFCHIEFAKYSNWFVQATIWQSSVDMLTSISVLCICSRMPTFQNWHLNSNWSELSMVICQHYFSHRLTNYELNILVAIFLALCAVTVIHMCRVRVWTTSIRHVSCLKCCKTATNCEFAFKMMHFVFSMDKWDAIFRPNIITSNPNIQVEFWDDRIKARKF